MRVILNFEPADSLIVDIRSLQPGKLSRLSRREIEKLPLFVGNRAIRLGEVCKVRRTAMQEEVLVIEGSSGRLAYAGYRMAGGKLLIAGDSGFASGAGMQAGEMLVEGSAGDCLGMGMGGGLIHVCGNAGDWCGAGEWGKTIGMCGGTILVDGNVGSQAGSGMRRGLVAISGNAGDFAGARMLAGTIFIAGKVGSDAGIGMKRGSLLAGRVDRLLPGFEPAGHSDREWLRIYSVYLRKMEFIVPENWLSSIAQRFMGDTLELGKGEIIVYDFIE
jgi:formylmethanofuran dehydrogenase subunit C